RSSRSSGHCERRRAFGPGRGACRGARGDRRGYRRRDAAGRGHRLRADPQGARVPGPRAQGSHVPHGVEDGRRPPESTLPTYRRESPVAPSVAAPTPEEIHRAKLAGWRTARSSGPLPSNVDWVAALPPKERARYDGSVRRKPSRTLSGVAVVAVMTAPARCPHGRCTYCPGGLENGSPQSYTGEEPSALRGAQFHFDAEAIARHRIAALEEIGHPTSKVEVIVMGGTFPARARGYQEEVFRGIYDGLNGARSASLPEAQVRNEQGAHRVVGLTVETRPDWCDGRVLPFLLDAGVTRVEIGVECLHEDVLTAVGRAHDVGDVTRATREARDRGLKIGYHLMLGLPGMDPDRDLSDFRRLWEEPAFRPDFLKIYP